MAVVFIYTTRNLSNDMQGKNENNYVKAILYKALKRAFGSLVALLYYMSGV